MKTCRDCGVELVAGENWYPSYVERGDCICKECWREYCRRWQKANPEKVREANRRWHEANLEKAREAVRRYRKANPERVRESSRRWYEANPEKAREKDRRWAQANSEKVREYCRHRRALKRNATIKPVDEQAVYELNGHVCIYCGTTENLELDHVAPLTKGGAHCEENLVVACRSCNSSKHDKPLEEWLQTQPRAIAWVV